MELRYMGFAQNQNTRVYKFDCIAKGESTTHFVVTADLSLFLKHHIGIQEGPALCAHKFSANPERIREHEHSLTNDDLLAYANIRAAADARKAERRTGVRRRNPA